MRFFDLMLMIGVLSMSILWISALLNINSVAHTIAEIGVWFENLRR